MKPVVRYSAVLLAPVVGQSATIVPEDHPDTLRVTNGQPATTTAVQRLWPFGFETKNTCYLLAGTPDPRVAILQAKEQQ